MAGGDDVNIWQDLLAKSAGKESPQLVTSDVIVLGDRKNGKSAVLSKLKSRQAVPNSPEYIIDYSYINVVNRYASDKEEVYSRMGVWTLDDENHAGLLAEFTGSLARTAFVITLDFSKPATLIDSLTKWLQVFKATAEKKLGALSAEEQAALKRKVSTLVQTYTDPSKKEEPKAEAAPAPSASPAPGATSNPAEAPKEGEAAPAAAVIDPKIPAQNYGVTLVVVGCKSDYFAQAKNGANDRFDFITQRLRKIILEYGGSLVFTSAVGEGTNTEVVEELLYHNVFSFPLKRAPKVVGSPDDFAIFTPPGFDSLDLIKTATTGKKSGWGDETPWANVFEDTKPVEAKQEAVLEALDDEDFFQSLAAQLASGKADPKAATAAPKKKEAKGGIKSFFKSLAGSSS